MEAASGGGEPLTTMTADTVTARRLFDLLAAIEAAQESITRVFWEAKNGTIDPAEAAAIVNETIENLTNEAR